MVDRIRLEVGPLGWQYIIRNVESGESVLVESDWDYPGLAESFGWIGCPHGESDGTVQCGQCDKDAGAYISEARAYLDDHIGAEASDPGYFGGAM